MMALPGLLILPRLAERKEFSGWMDGWMDGFVGQREVELVVKQGKEDRAPRGQPLGKVPAF